jgi:hypothetical protein
MDCRVKPGNDGARISYVMPALGAGIHVFLAGDMLYRTNSRIALSRPSSVSGYIRPPMS